MKLHIIIFDEESCKKDQDCKTIIKCIPPKQDPKVPKPKGKTKEKRCNGFGKTCTKASDCILRNCVAKTKKCTVKPFVTSCYSDADCKQAPKCVVKPGKAPPGQKKSKHCKGNEATECTNDVQCKIEGCQGKKCKNTQSKYLNYFSIFVLCRENR